MSRRRRVSRALLGALAVTIALGLVFWLHNLTKTKAAPAAQGDAHQPPPPPVGARSVASSAAPSSAAPSADIAAPAKPEPAKPAALVIQTPTARPRPQQTAPTAPAAIPATPTAGAATRPASPGHAAAAPVVTASPASSATPLVDAQAKIEGGDLLAARNLLNGAISSGKLAADDVKAAKQMLNRVNETVVFSSRRFADDSVGGTYSVKQYDRLSRIANQYEVTPELLSRINNNLDPKRMQAGKDIKVLNGPFHALVDKSDFTLEVWLGAPGESGSMYVTSFPVGLGVDDSTPTGTWIVETQKKIKNPTYFSPRGEGVIEADDPDNPLGEHWIGLSGIDGHALGKQSYGIHGTIRPESIGKQESMGCVRLANEDVAKVFELLVEGKSTVIIRE